MKKFLVALLSCSFMLSGVHAQSPFSEADLAAARNAAAQGSAGGQTAFKTDDQGNLVLGPDGKPIAVPKGVDSMKGDLRKFQAETGMQGVDPTSTPANLAANGQANVNLNQNFAFSCKSRPGTAYAAGSLAFRIDGCEWSGNTVAAANFSVCEQSAGAGVCASASDFDNAIRVPANRYVAYKTLQVGLGCNSAGTCQLTVSGAYTVGGNDQTLKTKGGAVQSNLREGMQTAITKHDYAGQMSETGNALITQDTQTSTTTGPGGTTVCAATPSCLREATTTTSYTKSCVRTFALTERKSVYNYPADATATCNMEKFSAPLPGDQPKTDTNSCGGAISAGPAGMTMVGATDRTCVPYADPEKNPGCASYTWTEYYVDLSKREFQGSTDSPAPVKGLLAGTPPTSAVCDTRDNSDTTLMKCESGNWFGRTTSSSCMLSFSNDANGQPTRGAVELDFRNVMNGDGTNSCGVCLSPTIGNTCYAQPQKQESDNLADSETDCKSFTAMDLQGCQMVARTDIQTTSAGGLVSGQREVYQCSSTKSVCVAWGPGSNSPDCMSTNIAAGTDKAPNKQANDGAMQQALVSAALVDSTANGLEVGSSETVPKVFGGEPMTCVRPVGGLGSIVQKNCCSIDLQRPKKGNIIQGGCSLDEAKLAAARRSSYATYIGEWCSRSIKFLGFRKCLEQSQGYCVFPGILPRLVQEQGRAQLQQMLSTSASATVQHGQLAYSYYSQSQDGNWAPAVSVNGVQFSAWQWPSYCSNPEKAAEIAAGNPNARECSGVVTTYIAACDIAGGCGPLPNEPIDGSLQWKIAAADPLQKVTYAVSRFGLATGACSTETQNCSYDLASWPIGVGGRAVVSKDITWTLFGDQQQGARQSTASYQLNNIGDLMFKGYTVAGTAGQPAPATVPLGFSRDGGQTWTTLNIPSDLRGKEINLGDTEVKITGSCDGSANACAYRVVGTVAVTLKPWGAPQNPDCTGFTAGQISTLDFGKMDLSEWLATVMDKIGSKGPQGLAEQANQQVAAFNTIFQGGNVQAKSPAVNFARAVPSEGFGPFTVRLAVSGVWPEVTGDPARDTDLVTGVTVDWGDCSIPEALPAVDASMGRGYGNTHVYNTPDHATYPCLKGSDADTSNIVHKIKLTVRTTNSGTQEKTVSVENAYAKFPGAESHNSNVQVTRTAPSTASQAPAAPRP